uniref:Uncharacterized protein n=1 Tax=Sinocyclocheilus anshuiensis TaxID=1608454 RepID=A0A671K2W6_9TELE
MISEDHVTLYTGFCFRCIHEWSKNKNLMKINVLYKMGDFMAAHFGFLLTIFLAPYYMASRTFAKIKKYITDFFFFCARKTIKLSI